MQIPGLEATDCGREVKRSWPELPCLGLKCSRLCRGDSLQGCFLELHQGGRLHRNLKGPPLHPNPQGHHAWISGVCVWVCCCKHTTGAHVV